MKLITIDFWNTLFDSSNGEARNKFRIEELRANIFNLRDEISADEYSSAMSDSWAYFNDIWKNQQRTPSSDETIQYFWKRLNLPPDLTAMNNVRKAFEESVLFFPPNLIHSVWEALDRLSEKFTLAVISDTGFSPGNILRRLMYENVVLHYFSAFSFSDETGVAKPHPKAYTAIFQKTGIGPTDACHIGDIEDTDILGAKSAGMHAIRFDGDPTAIFKDSNPKITSADYQSNNWDDIVDYIFKYEN